MTQVAPFPEIKDKELFYKYFSVSRETLDRFVLYIEILEKWQKTINLVAPATLDQVWHRHFADSAQLLDVVPSDARRWVDLGSGAGFPGLVIAILRAGRGGRADETPLTLIESDQRKAAFLREVARQTGVAVDIIAGRIEFSSTHGRISQADVVSARALAPLPKLLGLAAEFIPAGGQGVFLKGRGIDDEIRAAQRDWRFDCRLVPSRTDPEGRIVIVENLEAIAKG